jgi:polyisoprenoid-binding protein YceI
LLRRYTVGAIARPREALTIAARVHTPKRVALLPSGTWVLEPRASRVGFEVRHLMLARVRGRFRAVEAEICCDEDGVAAIDATIRTESLDTGDPRRDERLRDEDFFDAEAYPLLSFDGVCEPAEIGVPLPVRGTMTIRGQPRPLELHAEPAHRVGDGGRQRVRVRGRGQISRREFGLEWDSAFAAFGLMIDDRVTLRLDAILARHSSS